MHATAAKVSEIDLAPRTVDACGAARLLGIGRSKLYQLTAQGELPSVHFGRTARWLVADIDALIERKRLASTSPGRESVAS
jgi:excisionase family DNA binding protein